MQLDAPLATMCLNWPGLPDRFTHAATVTDDGSRDGLEGTVTRPPLNCSASSLCPAIHWTAPDSVPAFPSPEVSAAFVAWPSSRCHSPTMLSAAPADVAVASKRAMAPPAIRAFAAKVLLLFRLSV